MKFRKVYHCHPISYVDMSFCRVGGSERIFPKEEKGTDPDDRDGGLRGHSHMMSAMRGRGFAKT